MSINTPGTSSVHEAGRADADTPDVSAAAHVAHVAGPMGADAGADALKRGPIGALVLSIVAISLLLLGWILFYFLLFLGRGPVG